MTQLQQIPRATGTWVRITFIPVPGDPTGTQFSIHSEVVVSEPVIPTYILQRIAESADS
jgi:hypothetical protein